MENVRDNKREEKNDGNFDLDRWRRRELVKNDGGSVDA